MAALLAPLVSLNAQARLFSDQSELSPAMQVHLAQFREEMSEKISDARHQQVIQDYVEPTQVINSNTTRNGYRLEYRNRHQQKIILSSSKGKQTTQVMVS